MEPPKILNRDELDKFATEQATGIIALLEKALLSEKANDIQSCPNCSQEFALVEINIDPKTIENAWSGALTRKRAIEIIHDNIMAAALMTKLEMPQPDTEISAQIEELKAALGTLKNIGEIMTTFRTAFSRAKNSQEIHNLLVNTLRSIDTALKELNQ